MANTVAAPFESKHLFLYKPREIDKFNSDMIKEITDVAELSTAVTLMEADTGVVVAVGGVLPMWRGVGDIWMVGSDLIDKYPKSLFRLARSIINEATKGLSLHRVQCSVDVDQESHKRFVEHLGFSPEGLMRKYGANGEDHIRYAKVL